MAWCRGQAFYINTDHTGGQQWRQQETMFVSAVLDV